MGAFLRLDRCGRLYRGQLNETSETVETLVNLPLAFIVNGNETVSKIMPLVLQKHLPTRRTSA